MAISVRCPHCKHVDSVEGGGEVQLRCPACQGVFKVRLPASAPVARVGDYGVQAKAPPQVPEPPIEMAQVVRREAIETEDLPPRRRPRAAARDRDEMSDNSSSNLGLILGLSIGGGVFLLAVIGVVIFLLARRAPDQPAIVQVQPPVAAQQPQFVNPPNLPENNGFPENLGDPFGQNVAAIPPGPENFDKMLAELKSDNEDRRHAAYRWLKQADPNHRRSAEVTKILEDRVPLYRAKVFGDDQFFDAYFAWATKDNFPSLNNMARNEEFTVWGNRRRHTSMQVLARLKDERGIEAIAENLESIHHRKHAADALVAMGSGAEKGLHQQLSNGKQQVRIEVAQVLAVIGTRASLDALDQAARVHPKESRFIQEVTAARVAILGRAK